MSPCSIFAPWLAMYGLHVSENAYFRNNPVFKICFSSKKYIELLQIGVVWMGFCDPNLYFMRCVPLPPQVSLSFINSVIFCPFSQILVDFGSVLSQTGQVGRTSQTE